MARDTSDQSSFQRTIRETTGFDRIFEFDQTNHQRHPAKVTKEVVMYREVEKQMPEKRAYTVKEVARFLIKSEKTIYEKCRTNEIPHLRIGRTIIFPIVQFDNWFNGVTR